MLIRKWIWKEYPITVIQTLYIYVLGTTSKKNGIFNELGIKGGRGVILKHDFINWCNDETWGRGGGGQT